MAETIKKPKGTLIKVLPIKREIEKNQYYDSLLIWYRDENGVKKTRFVDRCKIPFYIIKDKESKEAFKPPMFIPRDKVEKVEVYSDMFYRELAMRTDTLGFYDRIITNYPVKAQAGNLKNILKHPWIYDSDMDVADRYIKYFNEEFEADQNYKLHKCYYDIEVDLAPEGLVKDSKGHIGYMGFPNEEIAPCPVNIITLVDGTTHIVYTLSVNNKKNALQQEFNAKLDEEKNYLLKEMKEKYNFAPNDMVIKVYDTERECIEAFFKLVHEIDPDYISGWNTHFDILTMMNRLTKIYNKDPECRAAGIRGYDKTAMTMCDSKYLIQTGKNGEPIYLTPKAYLTSRPEQAVSDRMDTMTIIDGINWIDQMELYANVRKSSGAKESYKLDAIAYEELGREKLDYTGYTLKTLPWLNYQKFVLYNQIDVTLLSLLEDKNLDFDMLQRLSEITNTRKEKVFKKTISLKNFICKFSEQQGFIMGNNKNAHYGDEGDYFEQNYLVKEEVKENDKRYLDAFNKKDNYGAYVGDPNLNDFCGIVDSTGHKSMFIFEHVFDEDFSSLYPSIIRAFNIDVNSQVGKFFLLDEHIKEKLTNEFGYDGLFSVSKNIEAKSDADASTNDIGPTLTDSLESQDWVRIGEKYFDLPSSAQVMKDLEAMAIEK